MSRKALKSTKDENPDLQKQIGCISGLFQLFDRHTFLTGQRHNIHSQNKPASGGTSDHIKEMNSAMQKAKAKNVKVTREKQQFFTESSITSMSSSSCSSSMSSIEFNRTHLEPQSIIQIKDPENSNSGAMKQLDFNDIVKDSMHRDSKRLSVKTKEKKKGPTLKYIDSPRPLQANEPFYNLAMYQKTPWDSPRLSYDDRREIEDIFKSATNQKELLPRLSLDSREGSIKGTFNEGAKSGLLKDPQKGCRDSSTILKNLQESDTPKRVSSVVAKLMGLEDFPGWAQTCEIPLGTSSSSMSKNEPFSRSSLSDEHKQHQDSASPRTCKVSTLLQSRRHDSIMNVTPYSRFLIEPTPWRQGDAGQGSQFKASKGSEFSVKGSNCSQSVYGEIEKRMAGLEFKNSGKDLRALKQILEAMQRYKNSLDITRDEASNSPPDKRNNSGVNESSKVQSPRMRTKDSTSVTVEMSNSSQQGSKQVKFTRKSNSPTNGRLVDKLDKQTAKVNSPTIRHLKDSVLISEDKRNKMRSSKLMQSSKVPQDIIGENPTKSPTLPRKFGLERRSPPTSPASDSSSNRRQHNRQSMELSSPSTTPRQRRDFKHHVEVVSPDFDGKRSLASGSDIKAIHIDESEKMSSTSKQLNGSKGNNEAEEMSKESAIMAETIATAEQLSPVSVLDAAFYKEDPPSPVKKKSDISQDSALNTDDDSEENSADLPLSSNTTKASFSYGTRDRDLKTPNSAQILQLLDGSNEEFIQSNDRKDPDQKYVLEILLVSGLLSSPNACQTFDSSGHLINPKLFLVMEEIKSTKRHFDIKHSACKNIYKINNLEQMQRKLLFDVINDILVQKLILDSSSSLWFLPNKPSAPKRLKGQQLLDELCTEIDQLQHKSKNASLAGENDYFTTLIREDLLQCPTTWTECYTEIPNIVLDIERLIFKDLITEVVRGEVANNLGRHCRKLLFTK